MKYQPPKKLSEAQISEAVRRYEAGESIAPIAVGMGVTRQSMWDLLRRRTVLRANIRRGASNHFYRGGSKAEDWAHNQVEKAILAGRLKRPLSCERCHALDTPFIDGRTSIQAHHDDYSKPLEVRWFCQLCHHQVHIELAKSAA